MRILIITDAYYPSRAACAVRMKVIAEVLRTFGHDVQVLACDTSLVSAPIGYQWPDYVHFFHVAEMGEKTVVNRLRNNLSGSMGAVKAANELGDFDAVFVTSPPLLMTRAAAKIAKRKNARLIFDVRDIWPDVAYEMGSFTPGSIYGRVFSRIANSAYDAASLITTVSPGKAEKIRARLKVDTSYKVEIIANGLDLNFVEQECDPAVEERFELDEGPICTYIGNIGLAQGLGRLLDLAKSRPDVRFLVFGDGAEKASLEARAEKEAIANVRFCGLLDSQGVYTVLRHSAVSFVPLVNSNLSDSVPTKMFEAIGCGCPVLLAAQGDSVRILDDLKLGIAAAPEDFDQLRAALDRLVDEPFSAERVAVARKRVAESYSRQSEAEKLAILIDEICRR
ncbi:glycosyltransferase family 4 protein [Slackia heliotrinireducens]|uniref:glycosyltransferase family 4 protein n=1 Tax=Slackia heliotrinireducens TaxID=84110 RepID=UPI00331489BD